MKPYLTMAAGLLGGLALAGTAQAQDAARGKILFQSECAACHSAVPGQNGIGPSLAGVYDMRAGMVPGYHYSVQLKNSNIVWTDAELNKFLMSPAVVVAGTKMPQPGTEMHMGVPSDQDRGDLIAYLRSLKQQQEQ